METFTELFPQDLTFESKSRIRKARKIKAILSDYFGDLSALSCLDLGCSQGHISAYLSRYFKSVVGVDVDKEAVDVAKRLYRLQNLSFKLLGRDKVPFPDHSFDVVVFNQIYEHVESPQKMFLEIKRVLRPGGVCFFGARNKHFIMDGHYKIPFLGIFPLPVANLAVKIFYSKPKYDINLLPYKELKKLVSGFEIRDYTLSAIKNPTKFQAQDVIPTFFGINKFLYLLAKLFYPLLPNYLWILEKR